MDVTPFMVMIAAVGLAVSEYSLLSHYYGRSYISRYKKVQAAFAEWSDAEIFRLTKKLLIAQGSTDPEWKDKQVPFVKDWLRDNMAITQVGSKYWNLSNNTKFIIMTCALSVGAALVSLIIGDGQSFWLVTAVLSLGAAMLATLYYVWQLHELTTVIARFEMGQSIDDILKTLPRPQATYFEKT